MKTLNEQKDSGTNAQPPVQRALSLHMPTQDFYSSEQAGAAQHNSVTKVRIQDGAGGKHCPPHPGSQQWSFCVRTECDTM